MGLLTDAVPWLIARLQGAAAVAGPVTYTAGSETADLTGKVWVGRTRFARTGVRDGAAVVHGDRDYLVPVADLVVNGRVIEPARGHRVTERVGEVDLVFEVMAPPDEPAWRYADPGRTLWRVHCKRVDAQKVVG